VKEIITEKEKGALEKKRIRIKRKKRWFKGEERREFRRERR